jgi:microcystin-dependent protein
MKSNDIILLLVLLMGISSHAQILISDEVSDQPIINTNASLELRSMSQDKGMLLPRVSLSARNLPAPLSSHVNGMIVYNTQTAGVGNSKVFPGLYFNDGFSWNLMVDGTPEVGDIKYAAQSGDHEGWYLLNGRLVTSLPPQAQANATSLGLGSNLPNSDNRFLKGKTAAEALGSVGGANQILLTQANLPNVTFIGTAQSAGAHTHSYQDRATGTMTSVENNFTQMVDNNSANKSTSSDGNHTHPVIVNLGGGNVPILNQPANIASYVFVYLGQ